MFMNIVPNSDSKQCPESKLGQVHSVHTLDYAARAQRFVAGLARLCRKPSPIVSWPGAPTASRYNALYRDQG